MHPRRILVVADESFSSSLRTTLEKRGFVVAVAIVGDLNQELPASQFDLIVVDLDAGQGADSIRHVRKIVRLKGTPMLALGRWGTGHASLALSAGADAYEPTPIDAVRLADAVERILNKRAAVVGMSE